jgi:hypothetical protein
MSYASLPTTFSSLSDTEKNRAIDKVLSSTLALSQKTFGIYHCFFDIYSVYRQSSYSTARRHFLLSRSKPEKKSKSPQTNHASDTSKPRQPTKYVPPHRRTETKPTSNDASAEKQQPIKPQAKPVRPRAHQPTPVTQGRQSQLTTDLLTKIDSSLRRHANDKEVIPTAITSMFESTSPDAPVFDRLFPGFPRQRLSDNVLRHQGKFTSVSKELFHQLLSDLASRLTKKLKLKLLPAHMSLLMKKLSAAINYKLRKSSKANSKKDVASKPAKDSDPAPAPASKPSKAKKARKPRQKKSQTSAPSSKEVVFVPMTEQQVQDLTISHPLADTDPNSEVYISKLTQVRDSLKLLKALDFARNHQTASSIVHLPLRTFVTPPPVPVIESFEYTNSYGDVNQSRFTAHLAQHTLKVASFSVPVKHTFENMPLSIVTLCSANTDRCTKYLSIYYTGSEVNVRLELSTLIGSVLSQDINELLIEEHLLKPF